MDVSFQLYSARNFQPWQHVLKRLASLGYAQVEGFGGVYAQPDEFAELMRSAGLTMPTAHFSLKAMEDEFDTSLALARGLGVECIFCPYLEEEARPVDNAGWKLFARRLAAIGENVNQAGLAFGWHNHDFEFKQMESGDCAQKIILEEAIDIDWEADIAWILRGGDEPLQWIEDYGHRITAVHVKDIAPSGQCEQEDGWADVGHGIVSWRNILRELKKHAKVRHLIVEHDNPSDFERFAQRSIEALKSMEAPENA
ncbi:MAG: sugar phosphate isomerase/epimerase [Pseudomonadota bacterium]